MLSNIKNSCCRIVSFGTLHHIIEVKLFDYVLMYLTKYISLDEFFCACPTLSKTVWVWYSKEVFFAGTFSPQGFAIKKQHFWFEQPLLLAANHNRIANMVLSVSLSLSFLSSFLYLSLFFYSFWWSFFIVVSFYEQVVSSTRLNMFFHWLVRSFVLKYRSLSLSSTWSSIWAFTWCTSTLSIFNTLLVYLVEDLQTF